METFSLLYFHIAAGTIFNPHKLTGEHGHRADCIQLSNGDMIGVFRARTGHARKIMEAKAGVTLLPPLHRPITDAHASAFSCVNAQTGEDAYSVAERLEQTFGEPWWNPESYNI